MSATDFTEYKSTNQSNVKVAEAVVVVVVVVVKRELRYQERKGHAATAAPSVLAAGGSTATSPPLPPDCRKLENFFDEEKNCLNVESKFDV